MAFADLFTIVMWTNCSWPSRQWCTSPGQCISIWSCCQVQRATAMQWRGCSCAFQAGTVATLHLSLSKCPWDQPNRTLWVKDQHGEVRSFIHALADASLSVEL